MAGCQGLRDSSVKAAAASMVHFSYLLGHFVGPENWRQVSSGCAEGVWLRLLAPPVGCVL